MLDRALREIPSLIHGISFYVLREPFSLQGQYHVVKQAAKKGARLFLKEVDHPWEYGIAEIQGEKIKRIIEKPKRPPTNLAVIGVYMYPGDVFKIVKTLKPSKRGELEITDVNNAYIRRGGLEYEVVNGWWMDAGENHESLLQANITVARTAGVKI